MGKITEELLGYLKPLMSLDPLGCLTTVQCLLRCVFKINAANAPSTDSHIHSHPTGYGQYHTIFLILPLFFT